MLILLFIILTLLFIILTLLFIILTLLFIILTLLFIILTLLFTLLNILLTSCIIEFPSTSISSQWNNHFVIFFCILTTITTRTLAMITTITFEHFLIFSLSEILIIRTDKLLFKYIIYLLNLIFIQIKSFLLVNSIHQLLNQPISNNILLLLLTLLPTTLYIFFELFTDFLHTLLNIAHTFEPFNSFLSISIPQPTFLLVTINCTLCLNILLSNGLFSDWLYLVLLLVFL